MQDTKTASSLNTIASKHLGQQGSYAIATDIYDSSFLVPMPRALARKELNIKGTEFVGYDTWHCHEATFLLDNGLPVAGTLKIICPADSEYMVESKSFKLYLNTFDMCKMGPTIEKAIANYEKQVRKDVSEVIGARVKVGFFSLGDDKYHSADPEVYYTDLYEVIEAEVLEQIQVTDYTGEGKYNIIKEGDQSQTYYYYTNVLRSRCRHTKQKDTGAAYFIIETKKGRVDAVELLKLVVSLREVNEFHEFCAEKLYTQIMSNPGVTNCSVKLLYSRRGSLDICPVRASKKKLLCTVLNNQYLYTQKAMGQ